METLTIRKPDDFHLHLRRGAVLERVLPHSARQFGRGLAMPNTRPEPILTADDALAYQADIAIRASQIGCGSFQPLMTIQITPATTPEIIREARAVGVIAGKLYPEGVTANSENGVQDIRALDPVFSAMAEVGMALCIHGESADHQVSAINREAAFLDALEELARAFPFLRIVLEHITTRSAAERVNRLRPNVVATITAHHLVLTLDDVIGYSPESKGFLQPHHFCKPIAKFAEDREMLIQAATSGNPKFFFGSDSAPHLRETKEAANVCAGIFTAPVALSVLAAVFKAQNALDALQDFTSRFGAEFYGLPLNAGTITLRKEPWTVPDEYEGIVPFMAGKTLAWQVAP